MEGLDVPVPGFAQQFLSSFSSSHPSVRAGYSHGLIQETMRHARLI